MNCVALVLLSVVRAVSSVSPTVGATDVACALLAVLSVSLALSLAFSVAALPVGSVVVTVLVWLGFAWLAALLVALLALASLANLFAWRFWRAASWAASTSRSWGGRAASATSPMLRW
jgi:hypothetical protein